MASKIRIFRSTGATAPSSLEYGELAVTVEQGTAGSQANKAGRLFIGNSSGNPVEIGGEYTYKLMDHVHGELINSSVAIVDSSGQINGWNVAGILTATRTSITDLVATNLNITGIATFAGNFGLNGDVTIGDSHTDTLTVNARAGFNTDTTLNENLLVSGISTFTGAANFSSTIDVDGGAEFDDINVSAAATVGILTVTGNANIDGALFINGAQVQAAGADGEFRNLTITGLSTYTGLIDANGGINVTGAESTFSSATVSDLTSGRVVLAGTSGALEDSGNLTFDGSTLTVTGEVVVNSGVSTFAGPIDANVGVDVSGGAGLVVSADGLNVTGVSTFNNNVEFAGTIDVDGQAIFDDITVSAGATFTGAIDANGGADISGGETTLSSATVSDLTSGRVVLAGTSGALEDSGNLTFDGTTLAVTGNQTVSGTIDVDGQAILDDVAVSAAATVTGATQLIGQVTFGSGGTKYTVPTADGTANQALVTNGSGSVTFQDISTTLNIAGDTGTDGVDLLTDTLTFSGTANEVVTAVTNNTVTVSLPDDVIVGGGLTVTNNLLVLGNLTVEGTETIINVERLDVQDKTIGVASTATASNTTANGGGFFVHGGGDGDKTIFWSLGQSGFEVNQDWLPDTDGSLDLGNASREWQNLFVDGLAELDDVNVSAAATINTLNVTGTGTIATADINGGNIDGTVIGAASSAAGSFTTLSANSVTLNGGTVSAGDVTFTNLRVTGISTLADLFLSQGTNTNGIAFFDASGQVTSTATPSAGIQTSNFILTTNASGVPSWTDTIDGGQF